MGLANLKRNTNGTAQKKTSLPEFEVKMQSPVSMPRPNQTYAASQSRSGGSNTSAQEDTNQSSGNKKTLPEKLIKPIQELQEIRDKNNPADDYYLNNIEHVEELIYQKQQEHGFIKNEIDEFSKLEATLSELVKFLCISFSKKDFSKDVVLKLPNKILDKLKYSVKQNIPGDSDAQKNYYLQGIEFIDSISIEAKQGTIILNYKFKNINKKEISDKFVFDIFDLQVFKSLIEIKDVLKNIEIDKLEAVSKILLFALEKDEGDESFEKLKNIILKMSNKDKPLIAKSVESAFYNTIKYSFAASIDPENTDKDVFEKSLLQRILSFTHLESKESFLTFFFTCFMYTFFTSAASKSIEICVKNLFYKLILNKTQQEKDVSEAVTFLYHKKEETAQETGSDESDVGWFVKNILDHNDKILTKNVIGQFVKVYKGSALKGDEGYEIIKKEETAAASGKNNKIFEEEILEIQRSVNERDEKFFIYFELLKHIRNGYYLNIHAKFGDLSTVTIGDDDQNRINDNYNSLQLLEKKDNLSKKEKQDQALLYKELNQILSKYIKAVIKPILLGFAKAGQELSGISTSNEQVLNNANSSQDNQGQQGTNDSQDNSAQQSHQRFDQDNNQQQTAQASQSFPQNFSPTSFVSAQQTSQQTQNQTQSQDPQDQTQNQSQTQGQAQAQNQVQNQQTDNTSLITKDEYEAALQKKDISAIKDKEILITNPFEGKQEKKNFNNLVEEKRKARGEYLDKCLDEMKKITMNNFQGHQYVFKTHMNFFPFLQNCHYHNDIVELNPEPTLFYFLYMFKDLDFYILFFKSTFSTEDTTHVLQIKNIDQAKENFGIDDFDKFKNECVEKIKNIDFEQQIIDHPIIVDVNEFNKKSQVSQDDQAEDKQKNESFSFLRIKGKNLILEEINGNQEEPIFDVSYFKSQKKELENTIRQYEKEEDSNKKKQLFKKAKIQKKNLVNQINTQIFKNFIDKIKSLRNSNDKDSQKIIKIMSKRLGFNPSPLEFSLQTLEKFKNMSEFSRIISNIILTNILLQLSELNTIYLIFSSEEINEEIIRTSFVDLENDFKRLVQSLQNKEVINKFEEVTEKIEKNFGINSTIYKDIKDINEKVITFYQKQFKEIKDFKQSFNEFWENYSKIESQEEKIKERLKMIDSFIEIKNSKEMKQIYSIYIANNNFFNEKLAKTVEENSKLPYNEILESNGYQSFDEIYQKEKQLFSKTLKKCNEALGKRIGQGRLGQLFEDLEKLKANLENTKVKPEEEQKQGQEKKEENTQKTQDAQKPVSNKNTKPEKENEQDKTEETSVNKTESKKIKQGLKLLNNDTQLKIYQRKN